MWTLKYGKFMSKRVLAYNNKALNATTMFEALKSEFL